MRRRARLLVAVSVLVLALGTWTTPAGGSDQKSIGSSQQTLHQQALAQAPLIAAADRIQQLVDARQLAGFAGTEIDGDALVLYWHGSVPAVLGKALDQNRRSVHIRIRPARYPLATLDAEARRVLATYSDGAVKLTSAGPLRDYSGLEIGVDPSTTASARRAIRSKVPLVIVDHAPAVLISRWADSSPFWGGAGITRGPASCSTAFAAKKNSNNSEVMITARHCGVNATWNTLQGGVLYGTSNAGNNAGLDAMLLGGRPYDGFIYRGPYTSLSGARVSSRGNPSNGAIVCHGGAFSGEVCNTRVSGVNRYEPIQGAGTVGPGFWTVHGGNVATAGQGDSGGPTYGVTATQTIHANGLIVAMDQHYAQRCQGYQGGRLCSIRIFSTNIMSILSAFGLTILTN